MSTLVVQPLDQTYCLRYAYYTYENKDSSRVSIALDLIKPKIGNAVKGFLVSDIVDKEDCMCACM